MGVKIFIPLGTSAITPEGTTRCDDKCTEDTYLNGTLGDKVHDGRKVNTSNVFQPFGLRTNIVRLGYDGFQQATKISLGTNRAQLKLVYKDRIKDEGVVTGDFFVFDCHSIDLQGFILEQ